ncbi:MAG: hypothetical protein H0V29_05550 [Thermoleophilaceae bacterium]|nr:hypothetical protein [Thermoleophilaceae bacterium]
MSSRFAALFALAGVLALPAAALAQAPAPPASPDRITMLAIFKTVTFGEPSFVSGRFRNVNPADDVLTPYPNRALTLNAAVSPFTAFAPVANDTTEQQGFYSFQVNPEVNTRYQVVASDPAIASEAKLIRVRFAIEFKAETTKPRRGREFDVTGTVKPVRPGAKVVIETRPANGRRYRQADRASVKADGTFTGSAKVRQDSELRARVLGDKQNLPSLSRKLIELDVRGRDSGD